MADCKVGDGMTIRLGLAGVEDNVDWIQSVVAGYPEFGIAYHLFHFYEQDVINILESHSNDVDMWLFFRDLSLFSC